jgi:cytohesin
MARDESHRPPNFQQALCDLLLVAFPDDTIRDFIATLPNGQKMKVRLPAGVASPLKVARQAVLLLQKFKCVEEALRAIEQERPKHRNVIAAIRASLEDLPSPPPAKPKFNTAPSLPANYVERRPLPGFCAAIARGAALAGVTGPPGAGKSVFAAAAARSTVLEEAFARVCWVAPEEGTHRPVIGLQKQLYHQLSGRTFNPVDWRDGCSQLVERASKLLSAGERLLVVIDDPPDPMDRVVEALRVSPAMTLVFCSENRAALHSLGADPVVDLGVLETSEARELLAAWCKCLSAALPPAAGEIIESVGGLPLAVAIVGAMVSVAGDQAAEWSALRDEIRAGKVGGLELPGLGGTGVLPVLGKALKSLAAPSREDLHALALVPADNWLEPSQLGRLWAAGADEARRRADVLAHRSLLRRADPSCYALHRLIRLVLRDRDDRLAERFRTIAGRLAPQSPPLLLALQWDDGRAFDAIVQGADADEVNRTAPQGVTALHVAALHGNDPATRTLLNRGADPRRASDDGFDALQCAAQGGDPQTLRVLLGAGVDPTHQNSGGKTALDVAARSGNTEAVRVLAAVPGAVQAAGYALGFAALYDHAEVVEVLLSAGADPNAYPADNSPPLHLAAHKGRVRIVEMLLGAQAAADIVFKDQTPLFLAATEGHEQVVDLLIGAGADPNWKTPPGRTVMHQAAQSGNVWIVARLAEAHAPVDASDGEGLTPLHVAAYVGHADVVKVLIARGAEIDRFDGDQFTPLHRAVLGNRLGTVTELLAAHADPSRRGQRGFSPLLLAVAHASPSIRQETRFVSDEEEGSRLSAVAIYQPANPRTIRIIRALAAAKAQIDAQDEEGQTALHWAVQKRSHTLTRLLLELGADCTRKDRQGRTPAALAAAIRGAEEVGSLFELRALAVESLLCAKPGGDAAPSPSEGDALGG